jgi:hypothetical protein
MRRLFAPLSHAVSVGHIEQPTHTVGCTYVEILGAKYPSQQLHLFSSAIVCSKNYSQQYHHVDPDSVGQFEVGVLVGVELDILVVAVRREFRGMDVAPLARPVIEMPGKCDVYGLAVHLLPVDIGIFLRW